MLSFFKHKKFWLPLILLILFFVITEVLLRMGLYDKWIKPNSFIGNAHNRVKSLRENGLEKIDWIIVGSSRVDWGLDHNKLKRLFSQHKLGYGRMSFESSKFTAIQATVDWSIHNFSSLDGIILGVSETELSRMNYLTKQFKVAWPFRKFLDFEKYQSIHEKQKWNRFIYGLAWVAHFADIKDFIKNPIKRFKQLQKNEKADHSIYERADNTNLCGVPLSTLNQCVEFAKQNKKPLIDKNNFLIPQKACSKPAVIRRAKTNRQMAKAKNSQQLIKNWSGLLSSIINKDKKVILLLLPEHETHKYIIRPSNANVITENIIKIFSKDNRFQLIDLRHVFNEKENCAYFRDPLHLNKDGIKIITKELIKTLLTLNLNAHSLKSNN
jgi:hypothetical protein